MCFGALQHRMARLSQQWISEHVVCVCISEPSAPGEPDGVQRLRQHPVNHEIPHGARTVHERKQRVSST